MTIDDLKNIDKEIVTPADIAPILHCDPNYIRRKACEDVSQFGFPIAKLMSRIKIPKNGFIKWYETQKDKRNAKPGEIITPKLFEQYKNEYHVKDNYTEIIIKDKNNNIKAKALINTEDIDKCAPYKWNIYDKKGYVKASINGGGCVFLHRIVTGYTGKLEVDHINRNKLDNRKENLRIVDRLTNAANNGKIHAYKIKNKWVSAICRNGKVYRTKGQETIEAALKEREKLITQIDGPNRNVGL